jgi:2'-5' RNA ligase
VYVLSLFFIARSEDMPFDGGARVRHLLYFLVYPPPAACEAVLRLTWRLRRDRGLAARPTALNRLHVSMNPIGAGRAPPPPHLVARAAAAADRVAMRAFRFDFDKVACWSPKAALHPWVLTGGDVVGLDLLYADLEAALAGEGIPRRGVRTFEPHMTLLRDAHDGPGESIPALSWVVDEFALVHSLQGEGRHEVLGRWRLPSRDVSSGRIPERLAVTDGRRPGYGRAVKPGESHACARRHHLWHQGLRHDEEGPRLAG